MYKTSSVFGVNFREESVLYRHQQIQYFCVCFLIQNSFFLLQKPAIIFQQNWVLASLVVFLPCNLILIEFHFAHYLRCLSSMRGSPGMNLYFNTRIFVCFGTGQDF